MTLVSPEQANKIAENQLREKVGKNHRRYVEQFDREYATITSTISQPTDEERNRRFDQAMDLLWRIVKAAQQEILGQPTYSYGEHIQMVVDSSLDNLLEIYADKNFAQEIPDAEANLIQAAARAILALG